MQIDPIDALGADAASVRGAVAGRCESAGQKPGCVTLIFEPPNDDVGCKAVSASPDIYSRKIDVGTTVTVRLDCSEVTPTGDHAPA